MMLGAGAYTHPGWVVGGIFVAGLLLFVLSANVWAWTLPIVASVLYLMVRIVRALERANESRITTPPQTRL